MIEKIAKNNDYIIAIKANQKSMFEGVKETHELKLRWRFPSLSQVAISYGWMATYRKVKDL